MIQLYHFEIGFPPIPLPKGSIKPIYSSHALNQHQAKGVPLFDLIDLSGGTYIEIEVIDSVITKSVIRFPYTYDDDIIVVLRGNKVITHWFNKADDTHRTLDRTKYNTP